MASTRLVLPWPLRPMNAVAPGSRATSTSAYERKLWRVRCATCKSALAGLPVAPGARLLCRLGLLGPGCALGVAALGCGGAHRVAAELVAHRGDRLRRRRVVLLGDEPGVQRGGDRRGGDPVLDPGLHGPPAL